MINKFLYMLMLALYSFHLHAQDYIPAYVLQIERDFNNITQQLKQQPNNDTLLLQRIALLDATTHQRYAKYNFNFTQYKIEDILKDIDYLLLKYKDKSIVTNDYIYTSLDLLLLHQQMILSADTANMHKVNQDIVNYIQLHKASLNIDTIQNILSYILESKYITEDLDFQTIDTNTYIQNLLKYTDLFNRIFPVELATTFNKQDAYMIREITNDFAPLNRFYFLYSPELNTRRIKYLKKLITFIGEILHDKEFMQQANIYDFHLIRKLEFAAAQIANLYYKNEDYKQAKLWMQTISKDNDTIIANEDNNYNPEFYQQLLHISLQDTLISIDKQLSYISTLLGKEYNEDLEEKHLRPIFKAIDLLEAKHPNNPNLLYLKGFALFKNRYAHILDYKNYTDNILAIFDKAQKLGLQNASMYFITGGIYKELSNDTLAQTYFQKAIAANPNKYQIPVENYGAHFIDYLMPKPINNNNISDFDKPSIPIHLINLAKQN